MIPKLGLDVVREDYSPSQYIYFSFVELRNRDPSQVVLEFQRHSGYRYYIQKLLNIG